MSPTTLPSASFTDAISAPPPTFLIACCSRSATAARQLASRARRRVREASTAPDGDATRQRAIVDAFLAASRDGDFDALLALLDPDVVLQADIAAMQSGASSEVCGAAAVAKTFAGRARAAQPALVDGLAGAVWAPGGKPPRRSLPFSQLEPD